MIRFACPHCQVAVRATEHVLGRSIPCPKCQRVIHMAVPVPPPGTASVPTRLDDAAKQGYWSLALPWIRRRKVLVGAVLFLVLLGIFIGGVWRTFSFSTGAAHIKAAIQRGQPCNEDELERVVLGKTMDEVRELLGKPLMEVPDGGVRRARVYTGPNAALNAHDDMQMAIMNGNVNRAEGNMQWLYEGMVRNPKVNGGNKCLMITFYHNRVIESRTIESVNEFLWQ